MGYIYGESRLIWPRVVNSHSNREIMFRLIAEIDRDQLEEAIQKAMPTKGRTVPWYRMGEKKRGW